MKKGLLTTEKLKWIWIVGLALSACSTVSRQIRIESNPSGAQVFLNDKNIGVTPLDVQESQFKEEFVQPLLNFKVQTQGYEPKNVYLSSKANQTLNVNLSQYTPDYFAKTVLSEFQAPSNEMVRELLQIQGLLVSKKVDVAQEKLNLFMQKYPNIAAGYVLQANLEISGNRQEQALRNLQRALSLDPQDPVVVRTIERLKREGAR